MQLTVADVGCTRAKTLATTSLPYPTNESPHSQGPSQSFTPHTYLQVTASIHTYYFISISVMMAAPQELTSGNCHVALTHDLLSPTAIMDKVRSPKAGAIILFAGTTRDNFDSKPVKELTYTSYAPKALKTMLDICTSLSEKHSLTGISMVHRLGTCPIGEESILIAVSSPHRKEAWLAGEEALEECKKRVEVWKKEEFDGEGGIWRANRDGIAGVRVDGEESADGPGPDYPALRKKIPGEHGHGPVVHPKQ